MMGEREPTGLKIRNFHQEIYNLDVAINRFLKFKQQQSHRRIQNYKPIFQTLKNYKNSKMSQRTSPHQQPKIDNAIKSVGSQQLKIPNRIGDTKKLNYQNIKSYKKENHKLFESINQQIKLQKLLKRFHVKKAKQNALLSINHFYCDKLKAIDTQKKEKLHNNHLKLLQKLKQLKKCQEKQQQFLQEYQDSLVLEEHLIDYLSEINNSKIKPNEVAKIP